jgi:squalene-hopene/tetraprenyl-beta-curcumene cyclase
MSSQMHSVSKLTGIENEAALEASIASATSALLDYRRPDGHWVFELEADSTIPAEYVLLRHYLGEPVDVALQTKLANYLRRVQGAHGGWPLVHDGDFDMSASVKAYFALRMIGDSAEAPHMARAREAIRSRGGAIHSNVFTRFMLAMFGVLTWRSVPVLPVEIMLLPMWSPFHINKISYWARTTIVPLMVLAALKPRAKNVSGIGIDDLFLQEPHSIGMTAKAPHQSWGWFLLFRGLDSVLRVIEPLFPKKLRARAIDSALAFIEERLNGEDGLGAIYPPMANVVMMYEVLGKPADYPPRAITRRGLDRLLMIGEHEALTRAMFSELIALFASGQLSPLPHREFRGQHIEDAFRLMQRSGHIGKILVRPAECTTANTGQTGRFPVDAEGLHIVFGGTSGAMWPASRFS